MPELPIARTQQTGRFVQTERHATRLNASAPKFNDRSLIARWPVCSRFAAHLRRSCELQTEAYRANDLQSVQQIRRLLWRSKLDSSYGFLFVTYLRDFKRFKGQ